MHTPAGEQEALSVEDFEEPVFGFETLTTFFEELFLGRRDETDEERDIRETAARDVLADLLAEAEHSDTAREHAAYVAALSKVTPLRRRRRADVRGVAA